jgi:dihydroorotase
VDYIESAVKPSAEQRPLSSYKDDIKIFIVPLVHFFLRNRVSPSVLRKALKEGGFSPEKMMPAPMASAAAGGTRRRRRRLHGSRKTPRRFH